MQRPDHGDLAMSRGTWVKLICGASNEDLPAISDLCALYAAAGVHCIDVAANTAVVFAARKGLDWVEAIYGKRPWLMISINDGQDVHFRKASFNQKLCPKDCHRPCEKVCPTNAISQNNGVLSSLCYGCGRCLTACPIGIINEKNQLLSLPDLPKLLSEINPDAIEIHTGPGRREAFEATVAAITRANIPLKRLAISCGLDKHIDAQDLSKELWERHDCVRNYGLKPIWQLDGRPMSGDLGISTSKFAVSLWQEIRPLSPPGPLQLAGGTNENTIHQLPHTNGPAGIAFGGMARKIVSPWLQEAARKKVNLRDWPNGWYAALEKATELIEPWLTRKPTKSFL